MSEDRYIIFSDLHKHNHGQDWRRVDDAVEVLRWIRKEAIEREMTKPNISLLDLAGGLAVLVTFFLIYDWYKNRR